MLLRLVTAICLLAAAVGQLQQNQLPYFGEDTPEDGAIFYSYPGTRFHLPTIYAFDDDLNGTSPNGFILIANEDFLDEFTGAGISADSGFNPYIFSTNQFVPSPATVSMERIETWTNRTKITYSFIDYNVDHFKLVPNPFRSVCLILRDNSIEPNNGPATAWNQRCFRIYVQLAPRFTQGCFFGTTTVPTQPPSLTAFVDACPRLPMQAKSVVAVGQEYVGHIYFEDYNRDGTPECTDCDQVVISVMANPGLPNGAALRNTVGGKDDTQSPAEYTNLMAVRYRDRGSSAVFNHLFSRTLTFTPAVEQSIVYSICVEAVDVVVSAEKLASAMGLRTNTTTQCLELEVVLPETRVLADADFAPHMPFPLGELVSAPDFEAAVKCDHQFSIVLYEAKDFDQSIVQRDQRAGFEQNVYIPIAVEDPEHPLPPGAVVGPRERLEVCEDLTVDCPESARTYAVTHQVLSWTPQRGLEGREWTSCVLLRDERLSGAAGWRRQCAQLRVAKCQVCTRHGETLLSIATEYSTDWLQLWGANPDIGNPYDLREIVEELDNKLVLGPVTTLAKPEAAVAVASRLRMTLKTLRLLNPDLGAHADVLPAGARVCVVPTICMQDGDINAV